MGMSIPPLQKVHPAVCLSCGRDNYGTTDRTCRGCGASRMTPLQKPVVERNTEQWMKDLRTAQWRGEED